MLNLRNPGTNPTSQSVNRAARRRWRQRPYKLTARPTALLDEPLQHMRRIASIDLRRLNA
jgi:hypothetical protein